MQLPGMAHLNFSLTECSCCQNELRILLLLILFRFLDHHSLLEQEMPNCAAGEKTNVLPPYLSCPPRPSLKSKNCTCGVRREVCCAVLAAAASGAGCWDLLAPFSRPQISTSLHSCIVCRSSHPTLPSSLW